MQQMARSSVFLSGMGGLGVEIGELVCVWWRLVVVLLVPM